MRRDTRHQRNEALCKRRFLGKIFELDSAGFFQAAG